MKRMWLGAALLVAVLGISQFFAVRMENIHTPEAENLKQAAECALRGDWNRARDLADNANTSWEQMRRITASVSNHEPMDSIDALFAELELYGKFQDPLSFSGTCVHLAELLQALGQEHSLKWWNLL